MIDRTNAMLLKFKELHGTADGVGLVRAPGRVNIIGEHTDYNEGYVLPIAIGRDTMVAFRPNDSGTVNVFSMTVDEASSFPLDGDGIPPAPRWLAYVAGVARMLRDDGVPLVGVDMVIYSTVPIGGGLSSSAALEVSTALALVSAAGAQVDRRRLAFLCQGAEHKFAGMHCGIMDQYVAMFAQAGAAVKIDCRSVTHELIPCPTETAKFVVCDTGVRHELASSEYNKRRSECEQGATVAAQVLRAENIRSLRDLSPGQLSAIEPELDPVTFRRVRHVVTEDARVLEAVKAMREQNYVMLGVLMDASHESLRDDYQVTCRELDLMVELAWTQAGVYGSRMTGGGFGGCTISLIDGEHVDSFCENVAMAYEERTGIAPAIYVCAPESGAEIIRPAG